MPPAAKTRTISNIVATSPGCAPLKAAYANAVGLRPKSWEQIEDGFLRAMEGFDANVASGAANMGDLQNGKGDFFNDLLALLLENCADVTLYSRGGVPGLIFPKHTLDVTYPSTGLVEFMLEAKAVGTPSALDKRLKEIGFKTMDLKTAFSRIMAKSGQTSTIPSGNLTTWLHSVKPRSYLFIAARVTNERDRDRVIRFADVAGLVSDAVGVFCFMPVSPDRPTKYQAVPVPSHIELGRALFRACQDLTAIKNNEAIHRTSGAAF